MANMAPISARWISAAGTGKKVKAKNAGNRYGTGPISEPSPQK